MWATWVAGYVVVLSVIAFVLMWRDKRNAKRRRKRRVRERTLLLWTWVGGALGTWLAMSILRHKTKHTAFRVSAPVATICWAILLLWALYMRATA